MQWQVAAMNVARDEYNALDLVVDDRFPQPPPLVREEPPAVVLARVPCAAVHEQLERRLALLQLVDQPVELLIAKVFFVLVLRRVVWRAMVPAIEQEEVDATP